MSSLINTFGIILDMKPESLSQINMINNVLGAYAAKLWVNVHFN